MGYGHRRGVHFLNVAHINNGLFNTQQAVENQSIICQMGTQPASWTTAAAAAKFFFYLASAMTGMVFPRGTGEQMLDSKRRF
jgi:hypothetical protein